jgi:hypothetical protein
MDNIAYIILNGDRLIIVGKDGTKKIMYKVSSTMWK